MPGDDGSGDGGRGGGLFLAVKKLLYNPSFFRSRRENDLFIGSPRKNSSSSSLIQRGTLSPSQSSLLSEESLPRNAGNELGFDIERSSSKNSEDGLASFVNQFSMLPLMNNVSSADEDSQQGQNQTTSVLSVSSCTPRVSRNSSISSGALMNNVSSADEDSQRGHNHTTSALPVSSCTPHVSRNSSISSDALMNNVSSADEDSQRGHNHTTSASPVSACTPRVSRNSSISSGAIQGEGSSPSHPRSCSGESLPISAGNELGFDDEMSLKSSEYRLRISGYISVGSLGSLRQSSIHSSAIQRESSVSHSHLSSDESLYGFPSYVLSFDMERNSLKHSEEWLPSSGKGSISSVNYFSVPPSDDEESYLCNHQTTSALSNLHNSSVSCAATSDGNEVYYFLSPVGLRSHLQSILRRACESLVPRMVSSSATEARAYRVEVENHVKKLVEDLQVPSTDVLKNAAAELQLLASLNMDNQILIAKHGAISLLINLLHSLDTELQESAVIALLHLSTNDNNKCMIVDADAIEPLVHVLSTGSSEAQETSVATLFSLSVIEGYKVKICRSIKARVELLANGTLWGKKYAATALYYLSILDENKYRIVQAGAVKQLIELMYPAVEMVDEAVCVLSNLSSIIEGSAEIFREGGIPLLVEILKFGSSRAKEDAAVALLQLCTDNRQCCNMVLQLGAVSPLIALSHCSNPRAQQLAQRLLNFLREYCIRKGDGQGVDLWRMSLQTSKDWLALSRDSSAKSVSCFSMYTSDGIGVSSHSSASSGFPSTIKTSRKSFKISKVEKLFNNSYSQLHKATNGFSNTNLIGYGSFSTVYRGKLEQGESFGESFGTFFNLQFKQGGEQTFAVKVLELLNNSASMSFHSECEVSRSIRHRNLVRILACCSSYDFEGNKFKALVYEFMENGNLDMWLHTHFAARTNVLSVLRRLNIAIDVASALQYLHHDCEPPVIHCNLKPSNIFLDKNLTAHVGDFGLSRFYSPTIEDSSGEQSSTIGFKGSIGYVPPEYETGAKASTFGDVYNYGILLLKMFTTKRSNDERCSLYEYVATALPEQVMKIVDPLLLAYLKSNHGWDKMLDDDGNLVKIKESEMHSFFLSIFKLGLSCASTSPLDRPHMNDVTITLQRIKKALYKE